MEIEFLELSDGKSPVKEFLFGIDDLKARKKILRCFELFEKDSLSFLRHSDCIQKMSGYESYKLYEFRIFYNKKRYRILCSLKDSKCYLVHGFIKKSPKTPLSEIATAIARIQLYL